jgi:NAD+ kinase
MTMRHIAIIYKHARPEAANLAEQLRVWLEKRQVQVFFRENINTSDVRCSYSRIEIPETVDAVIVLGGDGTLLSVARFLEDLTIPVVGINLGGLGFLTEISKATCFQEVEQILNGCFEIEERMRLQVQIQREGEDVFLQSVLNDIVISKGALARIIDIETRIDGRDLTHYRADGLIVSTPTGSTAYNLSAGGPIVYPTTSAIILTPICPFALTNRPIILPPRVTIQATLGEQVERVILTCDGQVGCKLASSDQLVISVAPNPLRLIKTPAIDYFKILRTKLKWGQS